ncbi:hypothetical protein FRC08_001972 [Ceratobasidium sp. 394]|nr:hypothetical protein FRC08_001972 [Ceratobasidium sp. 394]
MATIQPRRPRNIVILCDGTGKNGERDSPKGKPITNIWRLCQAIQRREGDIVEYLPGVGAYNDKVTAMDLLAQTFGHTAVVLVRKIYMTIAENYRDGDSISLFGYSRGAFIVRKVASLIGALGLITDEAEFNKYWEGLEHKLPGNRSSLRPLKPRVVPINCLGVWDTVGAVRPRAIREVLNLLTLPDDDLPEIVQSALHAVAYHENRKLFDVVLFDGKNNKQLCKQTLFPGAHSDVGGGGVEPKGRRNILPDVTLDWMLRNMPKTVHVALSEKLESQVPIWYPITSAFHDGPFWKRIPDKLHQREYLPTMYGLFRHRTLLGLPSPKSPHLLKHSWDWEHVDTPEEEVANGAAVVEQSVIKRITDKAKSSMTPTWGPVLPPPPELLPLPADITRSAELRVPQQHRPSMRSRLDSSTTNQTDFTTDTLDTPTTARTSLASEDVPAEFRAWLAADAPESPMSNSMRTSLLPIAEHAPPVIEKEMAEKVRFGAEGGLPTPPETPKRIGPVAGKPASTETRRIAQVRSPVQAHLAPVQGHLEPGQVPPAVPFGRAVQARPAPAQAPLTVDRVPLASVQAGRIPAQAGHTPAQTGCAPDQARADLIQVYPAAQVGTAIPVGPAPVQTGHALAQIDPSVAQIDLAAPLSSAPTQAGPAFAQARPRPVQAYPTAQAGTAVPAGPDPASAGHAPEQTHPSVAQVSSGIPVGRTPAQAGRAPTQVDPVPVQPSPAQIPYVPVQAPRTLPQAHPYVTLFDPPVPVSQAPAQAPAQAGRTPVRADPGPTQTLPAVSAGPAQASFPLTQIRPSPTQAGPPLVQASPAIPVDYTKQIRPVPAQANPDAQFHPTATQVYPTGTMGPTIRSRAAYSPATQARLAAQARPAKVGPVPQFSPAATQCYPQTYSVPYIPPKRRQKKSAMQKIMAFSCCGSSTQMVG